MQRLAKVIAAAASVAVVVVLLLERVLLEKVMLELLISKGNVHASTNWLCFAKFVHACTTRHRAHTLEAA